MNIYDTLFNSDGSVRDDVILSTAVPVTADTSEPGTYTLASIAKASGFPEDFTGKCLLVVAGTTQPLVTTHTLFANGKIWYRASTSDTWEQAEALSYEQGALDGISGLKTQVENLTLVVNNILDSTGKVKYNILPDLVLHNKGAYAREADMPSDAVAGDYCVNTTTDTIWVYDAETSKWVDSDRKGQVTSVNGKTGDVVLEILSGLSDEDLATITNMAKQVTANTEGIADLSTQVNTNTEDISGLATQVNTNTTNISTLNKLATTIANQVNVNTTTINNLVTDSMPTDWGVMEDFTITLKATETQLIGNVSVNASTDGDDTYRTVSLTDVLATLIADNNPASEITFSLVMDTASNNSASEATSTVKLGSDGTFTGVEDAFSNIQYTLDASTFTLSATDVPEGYKVVCDITYTLPKAVKYTVTDDDGETETFVPYSDDSSANTPSTE